MIGDVIKAKNRLGKLLGKDNVKKLVARVEKAQAQSYSVDKLIDQVKQIINKRGGNLLAKGDDFVEIVELLSTRPHTKSNGNFVTLVKNAVSAPKFTQDLNAVYQKNFLDNEGKYLNDIKSMYLEKYLKRDGQEFKNSRHKDASSKMQSYVEANRLKVVVTAIAIVMIDLALNLDKQNKKNMEKVRNEAREEGRQAGRAEHVAELRKRMPALKANVEKIRNEAREEGRQAGIAEHDAEVRKRMPAWKANIEKRVQYERQQADERVRTALFEAKIGDIVDRLGKGKATAEEFRKLISYSNSHMGNSAVLDKIETMIIPDDIKTIDFYFGGKPNLKKLVLPAGVGIKRDSAFAQCTRLVDVEFKGDISGISDRAFCECTNLVKITIPKCSGSIGTDAFGACSKLESITIKDGVVTLGDGVFRGCSKLKAITIPGSVKDLGVRDFMNCTGLESVVIKDGVKTIGGAAFMNCFNLKSIEVPNSVNSVGKDAFKGVEKGLKIGGSCKPEVMKIINEQTDAHES